MRKMSYKIQPYTSDFFNGDPLYGKQICQMPPLRKMELGEACTEKLKPNFIPFLSRLRTTAPSSDEAGENSILIYKDSYYTPVKLHRAPAKLGWFYIIFIEISRALTEWVSAPIDIIFTPVSALCIFRNHQVGRGVDIVDILL